MVDAALVHACADPALRPAFVEKFLEKVGTNDPLAVSIRAGNRVILVPPAKTPEQALKDAQAEADRILKSYR